MLDQVGASIPTATLPLGEFVIHSKPLITPFLHLSLNLFENPTAGFYGALAWYYPKVYEMSRLNLQHTVLNKRRLLKLVNNHYVRCWDDPHMPIISGMCHCGYTAEILNTFFNDARASNVVELQQTARLLLSTTSRRAMAALDPILVTITNFAEEAGKDMTFEVQISLMDASLGSHTVTMTEQIYIDSSDFRLEDSKAYYGLAPNKADRLKYHGGNLVCDEVTQKN